MNFAFLHARFVAAQGHGRGRDPCRTPMVWRDEPGAGFTQPGAEPWLPIESRTRNVAAHPGFEGAIVLGSDRGWDEEVLGGALELRPREAVVASVTSRAEASEA